MKRSAPLWLFLGSMLALGCPGEKPPAVAGASSAPAPQGPLVVHLSKSGLGFRISNADEDADRAPERIVAKTTPLAAEDAKKVAARLPELKRDPDDYQEFNMRAKSIPAPRPGKTVTESFPPQAGPPPANVPPPGPLAIERHAPEGAVELAPHLTLTFSQPMIPITSVDELARDKPPVVLTPEPPGKWRWLGTRTLLFQPEKRFPMATEFAVEVPAGTKATNGSTLAKPEKWTFSTPPLTRKASWPGGQSEPREPLIFISFDQAIDPAKVLGSIDLAGGGTSYPVRLAESDEVEANDTVRRLSQREEKGRWLAFRPVSKLPTATSFTVRVRAGAPSAEGPRRTTKDQEFGFRTFGALRVTDSSCSYYGSNAKEKCPPLSPFYVRFSNPIDRKLFDKSMVSVSPEIPGMKLEVAANSLTISGRTKGRTKYDVKIAGKIGDTHGQTMGEEAKVSFDVGSAEPVLFGAEQAMVVLDPASPRSYPVYSINEPGLRTRVFAVTPEEWSKYVAFSREWERPRKIAPPGRLVFEKVLAPKSAPDELATTLVDLAPALSGGLGHALVLVESTRPVKEGWRHPELQVWVQSTALGVDAFLEQDQMTGWVTRLSDGAPEKDVDVSLLGMNTSAKTDGGGLVRVPFGDKPGQLVIARRGKDSAIVPESWYGDSSYAKTTRPDAVRWLVYDDRGMYKPGEEVRVKGWVRASGVSRGGDISGIPGIAGKRVPFKVTDPRGAEIASGTANADDQGAFDLSFKLPSNANLGQGNLHLDLEGVGLVGTSHYHGFSIQEFRRPEFEVNARVSEGPHYVGGFAVATVTASYYAGGGLPSAPVNWSITRKTTSFTPPNRSAYHFGPDESAFWGWRTQSSPGSEVKNETWASHTNSQGVHRIRLDFDALDPSYPMGLDMVANVEDVNRQQWAGRASMLVHPSDQYVGIKLAKNFVRAGEKIDLDLVVSDVAGKLVGDRAVVVKAARLDWVQKGEEYEEQEVDVDTCQAKSSASDASAVHCSLKTTEGGQWRVWAVVTDEHGRKNQTATRLYVLGNQSPKDRKLDRGTANLVPDKKEYKPGDTAELLVVSPFWPAEGLLTMRRQGIVHVERFSMQNASTAIKVKLEDALVPNVEVAVSLVGADVRTNSSGDPDPKLPKRPAFAVGTTNVKVLPVSRTLAVKATAKKPMLEPGGATQIDVEVNDPGGQAVKDAEVAVVVGDEAVLALSGYKTPDPATVFYAARSGDVHEIRDRDRVMLADPDLARMQANVPSSGASYRAGQPGSPMPPPSPAATASAAPRMERAANKQEARATLALDEMAITGETNTPIAVRTNFNPLALFAPRVRTDGNGRATVAIKLPDNLTRYRVMAVASSGERNFGSNESTITARLPLMVRPSAPRFLNFGDKFDLPVVVQNQTDAPVTAGIVVRASNATMTETAKRVTIPANDRVEVRFSAETIKAGTARFQIGVAAGGWSDASQIELPVYTPATTEAFATYGEIDQGALAQPVKMPPNVFPQFGGLEITTSSTQLQALTDAFIYLTKYPFECNEQLASRVLAIAALRDVLTAFRAEGLPPPDVLEASMKSDFEKLKRRQNGNGGWGFWQETPWPYLTVHVAHALARAKDKGMKPDEDMIRRVLPYLRNIESYIPAWYGPDARRSIIAYALYVRKKLGDTDVARAKRLMTEAGGVEKLPIEAVGWIWPTISEDKGAQGENEAIRRHVANRVTETAGAAHFVSGYKDSDWVLLNSDRRADGILLESLIGDQPQSTVIPKLVKGLLDHRKAGRWGSTQENAFVLLSLDRYFHTYEKVTPDFVARAWLGDKFAGEHAFKGRTTERDHIAIPMQWLGTEMKGPQNFVLAKDGPGRLYYRIGMQYAPTDLKLPPADNGFVVSRLYEGADDPNDVKRDADGTWRVKAGAKVRVRVAMVAQSRRYHVALVDPLPAGFEAMNSALAVTGEIPKDPKATEGRGKYWYWARTWYEHENMRDERVEAFASLLWDGVWDYTYVARATTPGVFVVPPAKAEEMYSPETFGRSRGDRVIVAD